MEQHKYYLRDLETGYPVAVSKEAWLRFHEAWDAVRPKMHSPPVLIIMGTGGTGTAKDLDTIMKTYDKLGYKFVTNKPNDMNTGQNADMTKVPAIPGYISYTAMMCHEANRSYCQSIGDHTQIPWASAPDWQKDSAIKGVLHHEQHQFASPADSHNSWLQEKEATGWKYGPVKDAEKKEHPCYVPYEELPLEQKMKDYIFGGIAKAMLKAYHDNRVDVPTPTAGQRIMGVSFNPSKSPTIDLVKSKYAELMDLLDYKVHEHEKEIIDRQPKWDSTFPQEQPQLTRQPIEIGEMNRAHATAITNLQQSKMWAIEALTR